MGKKTDLESVHLVNHSKCMLAAFQNFRQDETMLDVTLVCEGERLKAHKLVLSACSPYFKDLFSENPCTHPIIILRNYEFADLKAVIDFIYKGELSVPRERLMSALTVAEELNIRGLKRSEPNSQKYEKLYNQVCGKLSSRKKRKRHRHDSTDSEKEYVNVSDSDQDIESDGPVSANGEPSAESQPMDLELADIESNLTNDKDIRPVVLRVGDPSVSNEESISRNAFEDEECITVNTVEKNVSDDESPKENVTSRNEDIEDGTYEAVSEDIASSSQQFNSYACAENSDVSLGIVPAEEQTVQEMESVSSTEPSEEVDFTSSCLSPKSGESQQDDNTELEDERKRFVCGKCSSVFTSREDFIQHKGKSHNNVEKSSYRCQHCTFTTKELDSFQTHLLTHSDRVPYKCSTCPEEFTSEELYKKHLSLHDLEKITLHELSPASGQKLFSTQNKSQERNVEFRCSICFVKFPSKLRCQIHEKMCQGGS